MILENTVTIIEKRRMILYLWIISTILLLVGGLFFAFGLNNRIKPLEVIGLLSIVSSIAIQIIQCVMIYTFPNPQLDKKLNKIKKIWGFFSFFVLFQIATMIFILCSKKFLMF